MNRDYDMGDIAKIMAEQEVRRAVADRGLQAVEETIYRVYSKESLHKCRDSMLEALYRLYPFYPFKKRK